MTCVMMAHLAEGTNRLRKRRLTGAAVCSAAVGARLPSDNCRLISLRTRDVAHTVSRVAGVRMRPLPAAVLVAVLLASPWVLVTAQTGAPARCHDDPAAWAAVYS